MLAKRILTALVLLPPVLWVMHLGGLPLQVLACLVFLIIQFEFLSFGTALSLPLKLLFLLFNSLLPMSYFVFGFTGLPFGILLAFLLSAVAQILFIEYKSHEENFQEILLGILTCLCYPGMLGTTLIVLCQRTQNSYAVLWLFLIVAATDTFAYFVGKTAGGIKLAPRISPNKTVSGALGGLLGGGATAYFGGLWLDISPDINVLLFGGALISIFSQLGDLFESLVKRVYQIKDAGTLIPGHGGLLDRVDGLLFAAPVLLFLSYAAYF